MAVLYLPQHGLAALLHTYTYVGSELDQLARTDPEQKPRSWMKVGEVCLIVSTMPSVGQSPAAFGWWTETG